MFGKILNAVLYFSLFLALFAAVLIAPFKFGCGAKTAWIQAGATLGLVVWGLLAKQIFRTFEDAPDTSEQAPQ